LNLNDAVVHNYLSANQTNKDYTMKTLSQTGKHIAAGLVLLMLACLLGCARPPYHVISLKPHPSGAQGATSESVLGLLPFEDTRSSVRVLGKRVFSDGEEEKIVLDSSSAAKNVTQILLKYLKARGIRVVQLSSWQPDPEHLGDLPDDVDIAIAGKIEALEVEAQSSLVKTLVRCRVRLSARLGIKKQNKVITRTAEASPEITLLRFDRDKIEEGLNEALALAQTKLLEGII
jgi:hypothetical protein